MTKEIANFLVEVSEDRGHDAEVREGYSGRGMMGEETYGVVIESVEQLLADVLNWMNDEADNNSVINLPQGFFPPSGFRSDNMGRRIILY